MEQLAAEKVNQILETHTVAPLAEDIQKAISDIVARELKWIISQKG
jgi:trimethylamine:corrinoid methyltransferase-like protein